MKSSWSQPLALRGTSPAGRSRVLIGQQRDPKPWTTVILSDVLRAFLPPLLTQIPRGDQYENASLEGVFHVQLGTML